MWTLYRLALGDPNNLRLVCRQSLAPHAALRGVVFGTGGGSAYVWLWEEDPP